MDDMASITLRDFKKVYPTLHKLRITPHLIGPPGCGKSFVIRTIPEMMAEIYERPFGYREELVPSLDAPDVRGFLVPSKDKEGKPVSMFTYPPIFPSREYLAQHPYGVLFLDENNLGDHLTQKALAPVKLDLSAGQYHLPKTWNVICASNRMQDKAGVQAPLMHDINRELRLNVDVNVEGWVLDYADPAGVHPMCVAFAKARPGSFVREVPADRRPFCSFRSYTKASEILADIAGVDKDGNPNMHLPSDGVTQALVAGAVGDGVAAEMFAFFKVANELAEFKDILASPETAKVPSDHRLDAAYAQMQLCVHHVTAKNADKVWTYMERLPLELQTSAAKSMLEKAGGQFLNSKKFGAWIAKHRALVMATTAR